MIEASSTAFGPQWEEASVCDLCGAAEWRPAGSICGRRYGRCAGCGVVRLVDRVAESALGLLYAHYYNPEELSREALEHQLKNPTFAHRLRRIESMRGSLERRILRLAAGTATSSLSCNTLDGRWTDRSSAASPCRCAQEARDRDHRRRRDEAEAPVRSVPGRRRLPRHRAHLPACRMAPEVRDARRAAGAAVPADTELEGSLTHALTGLAWASMTFPQHVYLFTPTTLSALSSALRLRRALCDHVAFHGTARARRIARSLVASSNSPPAGCPGARRSVLTRLQRNWQRKTSRRARRFGREGAAQAVLRVQLVTLWRASSRWLDRVGSSI